MLAWIGAYVRIVKAMSLYIRILNVQNVFLFVIKFAPRLKGFSRLKYTPIEAVLRVSDQDGALFMGDIVGGFY